MKYIIFLFSFLIIVSAVDNQSDASYVEELFIVAVFLVIIFFYRQELLRKNNEKMQKLQDELVEINYNLEAKFVSINHDLQKAQEVAKIGSWVLDNQKQDLRWSLQTYRIFNINPDIEDENLYNEFIKCVHPEDRDRLETSFRQSLKNQENYQHEHRLLMDDGSIKYVLEHCETSFDEQGRALVSYGTVQDITENTLRKIELIEKDLQLLHKSRLAQMGEMMSMIAHQWKQPLGLISAAQISILMAIEMEQYDLDDKKQREEFLKFTEEKLHKVSRYVQNLSQIISDFSDFYRPNKKSEAVRIDDVVNSSFNLFGDSISSANIELELDIKSKDEVYMHENEFMQVILNIVMNAREQLMNNEITNPKITIKTYHKDDDVYLEIIDNAGGIKEDVINKVFEPYFSTKLDKNGTGLGLYMSKTIIKDYHHGDIYAQNSEDGAIFTIKIKKYKREIDE